VFFRRRRGAAAPGRGRLVLGNLLVLASLFATAVLAAETYLRYVYDATDSYGLTLTNFSWFRRHVWLNSSGLRDREFERTRRPGVTRVACLGDSFTLGYGVARPADVWPQRIAAALESQEPGRFDVRNHGIVGLDSGGAMDIVDSFAARGEADQILLGYCLNDIDDLLPPQRQFDRTSVPRVPLVPPTCSFLADFLWYRLRLRDDPRVRGYFDWEKEVYDDPRIFAAQAERFRHIAETCRRGSIRLDVVVFPFFSDWGAGYRFDSCHDRVAAAWKAAGVGVVDLRAAYRGIAGADLVVNRYDAHPNERAHEIAARTILDRVFRAR
jgi:lysophospholipase L1-like esterase